MKTFYLIALAFLCSFSVYSQREFDDPTQAKEIPPPPTMWEFEKYGTYPVSMHTGVPNISIPITVAKSGMLTVPVSINYHASGIKVDQKASWVGLGWTLNAGGAITRTVRGGLDEANDGYINSSFKTEGTITPNNDYAFLEDVMLGSKDSEPDVFNYSFLGYSGKFIFNHSTSRTSAVAYTIPHSDLTITPTFSGASIISFTILTPDGITAEFDYPEGFSENRSSANNGTTSISGNSTWHLKKLTAPNGEDEIVFEYTNIGSVTDPRMSFSETVSYYDPCGLNNYSTSGSSTIGYSSYTNVKRIQKITFNNGYIIFDASSNNRDDDPNNEDRRLDEIEIYQKYSTTDALIKKFVLAYNYFGTIDSSNTIADENEVRLKLTSVTERAANNQEKPPYTFTYQEGTTYTDLPYRLSYDQDYWGYFNGNHNNTTLTPKKSYTTINGNATFDLGDADRDIDTLYTRAGVIKKIVYPTKGYTTFEFENNRIRITEPSGTNEYYAGGLRARRIRSYDHDDSKQWEKYYEYTTSKGSGISSGVYNGSNFITANNFLKYNDYYFSRASNNPAGSCPAGGNMGPNLNYKTDSHVQSSTPAIAKNFATSFYGKVIEYDGNPTTYNGYKVYEYDTTKDDLYQTLGPLAFYIDRSWDRGQLKSEKTYENGNSTPVAEMTNTYETVNTRNAIEAYKVGTAFGVESLGYYPETTTITNSSISLSSLPGQPGVTDPASFRNQQYLVEYYDEHISWKRLKTTVAVQDGVSTQTDYYYNSANDHINPIKITSTTSDNVSLETKRYYAEDVTSASSMAEGGSLISTDYTIIDRLKADDLHMQNALIQEVSKKNGQIIAVNRILYRDDTTQGGVLPKEFQKAKGTNTVVSDIFIDKRDVRGNVLQYHTKDGTHTSVIYGYARTYPIAKVVNATYTDIEAVNGFGNFAPNYYFSENLTTALKTNLRGISNALVTTYEYDPLIGVISITQPNNETIHYEYDEFHRLVIIKDDDSHIMSENAYNYKN